MHKNKILSFLLLSIFIFNSFLFAQGDRTITIHLRGVEESKISLTPYSGARAVEPIVEIERLKKNQKVEIIVPEQFIPGEFVLRADYIAKQGGTPYPSEKTIFINRQDFEIYMHPMFINNADSTTYSFGEHENTIYNYFKNENPIKRIPVELLKNFLLNYDDTKSAVYKKGVKEYEKRRNEYNKWLENQFFVYNEFFVSHLFQFQYITSMNWKGGEEERISELLNNYFDGINFNDSLIIRTPEMDRFMNNYMNMFGVLITSMELQDSLFTYAGRIACEKASKGHPYVYGWVVDYFNNGYKAYNIEAGKEMIKKHIENPNCLTAHKREVARRIAEMTNLKEGVQAPNFVLKDDKGQEIDFHAYNKKEYKILLIWSADCGHCFKLKEDLNKWYNEGDNNKLLDIIAVSLDETETEVPKWEEAKKKLPTWIHIRAEGGSNSHFARDYAILAVPVLFLVDSKTNLIKTVGDKVDVVKDFTF